MRPIVLYPNCDFRQQSDPFPLHDPPTSLRIGVKPLKSKVSLVDIEFKRYPMQNFPTLVFLI